ncbi:MAG: adenine deaminase [Exilispira sp.]
MSINFQEYQQTKNLIEVANRKRKADLLIRNANIVNVFTESIEINNIAIYKDKIAGIGNYNDAEYVINADGLFASPSFIDSHIHIESTKLIPYELSLALLPKGTTTIVCDPHEIANVSGLEGIEFLINSSKNLLLDIYFLAPGCVPATKFETNYQRLDIKKLKRLKKFSRIIGLAEVMNYPAVINGEKDIVEKLILFDSFIKDGHCPGLEKEELNAYICPKIYSDHECISPQEAYEKLSRGMYIMLRNGSASKDIEKLLPVINDKTKNRILLCTDDKDPDDIINEGHINHCISILLKNNISLPVAIKMATLNPSIYFNFKGKGAIAPGYFADIVLFENMNSIKYVIKNGKIIYEKGILKEDLFSEKLNKNNSLSYKNNKRKIVLSKKITDSINIKINSDNILKIKNLDKNIRVINVRDNSIVTDEIIINPRVEDDYIVQDIENDILKIAVIERHHKSGNYSIGFIKGFGLKRGAIASSISHDSHNIISIGTNDHDMLLAIKHLKKIKGGIAIALNGSIIADLPLLYSGLISDLSLKEVSEKYNFLKKTVKEINGSMLDDTFMTLSFMSLPVIPKLKITDKGIFDVDKFNFVSLYVD